MTTNLGQNLDMSLCWAKIEVLDGLHSFRRFFYFFPLKKIIYLF